MAQPLGLTNVALPRGLDRQAGTASTVKLRRGKGGLQEPGVPAASEVSRVDVSNLRWLTSLTGVRYGIDRAGAVVTCGVGTKAISSCS